MTPVTEVLRQMMETVDELETTWEFVDLSDIRRAIDRTLTRLDESKKQRP